MLPNLLTNRSYIDINLAELQKTLDAQGVEVVQNQKESVLGRKSLADRTKGVLPHSVAHALVSNCDPEFKKIPDEGKVTAIKGLLKGMWPTVISV